MLKKPKRLVGISKFGNILYTAFNKDVIGHSGDLNENICSRCIFRFWNGQDCGLRGLPYPHRSCRKFDTEQTYYIPTYYAIKKG